jgi:hypothetical protein
MQKNLADGLLGGGSCQIGLAQGAGHHQKDAAGAGSVLSHVGHAFPVYVVIFEYLHNTVGTGGAADGARPGGDRMDDRRGDAPIGIIRHINAFIIVEDAVRSRSISMA